MRIDVRPLPSDTMFAHAQHVQTAQEIQWFPQKHPVNFPIQHSPVPMFSEIIYSLQHMALSQALKLHVGTWVLVTHHFSFKQCDLGVYDPFSDTPYYHCSGFKT